MEKDIYTDRAQHFKGSAEVKLKHLAFDLKAVREIDPKNVARLKSIFRLESCSRLDPQHHIPALLSLQDLEIAAGISHVSIESLSSPVENRFVQLNFPEGYQLQCLHGRHRIQAAKEHLKMEDAWWVVDLYLEGFPPAKDIRNQFGNFNTCTIGMGTDAQRALREEYDNSLNVSDGTIYANVREHQQKGNVLAEKRWWARLSEVKRKELCQLLRDKSYTKRFDALLSIPGMRPGMRLGAIHKIMRMRCDQVRLRNSTS